MRAHPHETTCHSRPPPAADSSTTGRTKTTPTSFPCFSPRLPSVLASLASNMPSRSSGDKPFHFARDSAARGCGESVGSCIALRNSRRRPGGVRRARAHDLCSRKAARNLLVTTFLQIWSARQSGTRFFPDSPVPITALFPVVCSAGFVSPTLRLGIRCLRTAVQAYA